MRCRQAIPLIRCILGATRTAGAVGGGDVVMDQGPRALVPTRRRRPQRQMDRRPLKAQPRAPSLQHNRRHVAYVSKRLPRAASSFLQLYRQAIALDGADGVDVLQGPTPR